MAGIGIELKKIFKQKGVIPLLRGYGYTGIIVLGPMLLGIILLFAIRIMGGAAGAAKAELDSLVSMITYTLLLSQGITSIFSMITSRYTANMLYEERYEKVMPSFYGSVSLMLVIGFVGYGSFLIFAGIPLICKLLCLIILLELIVTWTGNSYLMAVKNFKGVALGYVIATAATLLLGGLLLHLRIPVIEALLSSVALGYGVMMVVSFAMLLQFFPDSEGSSFSFLELFDTAPSLWQIGILMNLGMTAHIVIMWTSAIGEPVQGLFYSAPLYDVPALYAFLSIFITSVNFITSIDMNFYPRYKTYIDLLNKKGSLREIIQTENEMVTVLIQELNYMAQKQLFTTLVFIIVGGGIFMNLGFGFTKEMISTYRILCVGYAFYAVANTFVQLLLYFDEQKSALLCAVVFAAATILGTFFVMHQQNGFYGLGFVFGGICFYLVAWWRLKECTTNLKYYLLCEQPLSFQQKVGIFTRLSIVLKKWELGIAKLLEREMIPKEEIDENSELLL